MPPPRGGRSSGGRSTLGVLGTLCIVVALCISGYVGLLVLGRSGGATVVEITSDGSSSAASGAGGGSSSAVAGGQHSSALGPWRRLGHSGSDFDIDAAIARLEQRQAELGLACPKCPAVATGEAGATQPLTTAHYLRNPRRYHIITTTAGFNNHWQVRVHYYWFKKQKEACERQAVCDMGGFTRLLHTGQADDLMDEVPTVVVNPLPKSAFGGQDDSYIVLNRPWAFVEWLKTASVPERYILMCESDHLFLRPIPNLMNGEAQGAALFSYMNPKDYPAVVRSLVGNISDEEIATIPRIGNSPTFISVKDMRVQAPMWYNTTMEIWRNEAAHKAWNWVLEMYGYTLATYKAGLHRGLLHSESLLSHPPFDANETNYKGEPYYILHLTYPMRYNLSGSIVDDEKNATWLFDKRKFSEAPPPRNIAAPPEYVKNNLVRLAIAMINEATDSIPCWDTYQATKVVTTSCPASAGVGALAGAGASLGGASSTAGVQQQAS